MVTLLRACTLPSRGAISTLRNVGLDGLVGSSASSSSSSSRQIHIVPGEAAGRAAAAFVMSCVDSRFPGLASMVLNGFCSLRASPRTPSEGGDEEGGGGGTDVGCNAVAVPVVPEALPIPPPSSSRTTKEEEDKAMCGGMGKVVPLLFFSVTPR